MIIELLKKGIMTLELIGVVVVIVHLYNKYWRCKNAR